MCKMSWCFLQLAHGNGFEIVGKKGDDMADCLKLSELRTIKQQ